MTLNEFETCLDLYGSKPALWPAEKSKAAQALLATSSNARLLLADAAMLDNALSEYTVEEPDAAFEASLLDLAPKPAKQTSRRFRLSDIFNLRVLTMAGASFACATFGLVIGYQSVASLQTEADADAFLVASASYSMDETFWAGE